MTTDKPIPPRKPPTAEQQAALMDYWLVYEANYDAIAEVSRVELEEHPEFGPLIRNAPKDQMEAQSRESRERLKRAIHGDWEQYESNLRMQGAVYAKMGITFQGWYDVVSLFTRHLTPLLVKAYCQSPDRLSLAIMAMHDFLDRGMAILGEAYLNAKEAALRESEQKLATTLDSIGDAVIATDIEAKVTRMNPVAEELTGWKLADAAGHALTEVFRIVNEDTGQTVDNPAKRVLREGVVVGLANHTVLIARDGVRRPIADSGAPIRSQSGDVTGVVLVFRDMSEERRAETALQRWEQIFRFAGWGVSVTAANGSDLEVVNPAFAEMHGYAVEEAVRIPAEQYYAPQTRQQLEEMRKIVRAEGHCAWESVRVRKDGSMFPVLVDESAIRDHDGKVTWYAGHVTDLTERKRLEEADKRAVQLEAQSKRSLEASRQKSEFLANMSHELRTPLNAIIGFAELIHDGEVRPEMPQFKEFVGDILNSGRHLLQLINDVLDLSKVEAGKLDFHPEDVDLEKLIGEVIAILRTTASNSGIKVETVVDPVVRTIVADPSRLKQVLYNYVSNALKFTPPQGRVTVRAVAESAETFRLTVEDTGIGISPDDTRKLFVEFQQLDSSASKKHGGTGLGLALTRRLVEAQSGSVGVVSTPGQGSLFHAILPRRALQDPGTTPLQQRSVPGAQPRAATVLIIEDSEQDRATLIRALSGAGYAVETAATGAQALEKCRTRAFAAITLDLLLPDASGLEVLRSIRLEGMNRDVPVIVVTVVTETGATAGFAVHDVLAKPLDAPALLRSLDAAGVTRETPGTILVVDDDPAAQKLMAATLAQFGYHCRCASDGDAGLASALESPPLAVILDMVMPGMDGLQFLDCLRRLKRCRLTPVIVWTAKDLTTDELTRLRSAAQGVVRKSEDGGAAVLEELRAFLPGRKSAQREPA